MCTAIWTTFRDDPDIKALMLQIAPTDAEARLFWNMAPKKQQPLYVNYLIQELPSQDWPMKNGALHFSIYDFSENALRAEALADQIEATYANHGWLMNDQLVEALRTGNPRPRTRPPTGSEEIIRIDLSFEIRWWNEHAAAKLKARTS